MECRYCQAWNAADDHRCRRCGRRLRATPVYTTSSAAPVLEYENHEHTPAARSDRRTGLVEVPAPAGSRRSGNYQQPLFSSRELLRVVHFETPMPEAAPSPTRPAASPGRPRQRKVATSQQGLEFSHAAHAAKPLDGVIYCDAPVAIPAHRAMAAALDASLIAIGLAVFGTVFRLAGGEFVLNAKTLPMFLGAVAGLVVFYRLLWWLANGDTAGQSWAHLRLVNFDGHRPNRTQRFCRMVSGFLSLLAAGIGLLWALVDEETLTWHDHISKTFPTPAD